MKTLTEYIKESLANESTVKESVVESDKVYRFDLNKIEGGNEVITSIDTMASAKGFYSEKTDDGVLVKFNKDNISKASAVLELIHSFIDAIPSDVQEKNAETLEKLGGQIEKLEGDIEDTDAAKEEAKKTEDNAKEEPKKEEE